MKAEVCPEVWLEGGLGVFPTPLVLSSARGGHSTLLLLPALQKWWLSNLVFLLSFVQTLPLLYMQAVIFSPMHFFFFCILLLEETFVQVQALQPRVPSPSLSSLPLPFQPQSLHEFHWEERQGPWPSVSFTGCP